MRAPFPLVTALALSVLAGCVVSVENARCQTSANCPSGQACVDGQCYLGAQECFTDCAQANAPACDPSGAARVGTCVNKNHGCLQVEQLADCAPGETCSDGACQCPALSATPTAGAGCSSPGEAYCDDGGTFIACNTVGSCQVWTVDPCATSGLSCSAPAGHDAGCYCPPNPTGVFAADPISGSDSDRGVLATGLDAPASCRYRTLGDALRAANAAGGTVVALGFDGGERVDFSDEQFPLVVGSGTGLFTSDCPDGGGACVPAHYGIVFGADGGVEEASAAVVLDGGATIAGFSIVNQGGDPLASLVWCGTGSVEAHDLVLRGSVGDAGATVSNGFDIAGDCSLAAQGLDVGSVSGAGILEETTGTVTLDAPSIGGPPSGAPLPSRDGIQVTSGDLTVNGGFIRGAQAEGALLTGASTQTYALNGIEVTGNGIGTTARAGVRIDQGTLLASGINVHHNGGAGLELGTDFASVSVTKRGTTRSTINNNGTSGSGAGGVNVLAGSLTATALVANANSGPCVSVAGGTATLSGLECNGNFAGLVGNGTSANLVLSSVTVSANSNEGLRVTAGQCSVEGPSTFTSNGVSSARAGVRVQAGAKLTMNGGDGGTYGIVVSGSGTDGLQLEGAAALSGVEVGGNVNGISVATVAPVSIVDSFVHDNGSASVTGSGTGINVTAADGGVVFTGDVVSNNLATGVSLTQSSGPIAAAFNGCTVSGNNGDGVVVNQGTSSATPIASFLNTAILKNGQGTSGRGAGVRFTTDADATFAGNQFLGNYGSQLTLTCSGWTLGTGSACDATSNAIGSCPNSGGAVGIVVTQQPGFAQTCVNANFVTLDHSPPNSNDAINTGSDVSLGTTVKWSGPGGNNTACVVNPLPCP